MEIALYKYLKIMIKKLKDYLLQENNKMVTLYLTPKINKEIKYFT